MYKKRRSIVHGFGHLVGVLEHIPLRIRGITMIYLNLNSLLFISGNNHNGIKFSWAVLLVGEITPLFKGNYDKFY